MGQRVYFYKDADGTTKKYAYCSMCGAGPFKEDSKEYIRAGGARSPMVYCRRCARDCGIEDILSSRWLPETVFSNKPVENLATPNPVISEAPQVVAPAPVVETPVPVAATPVPVVVTPAATPVEPVENPTDFVREECAELLRKELRKEKEIPTKGKYLVYIGDCADGSYICGVTNNLKKENAELNNGHSKSCQKPVEIVFFRAEKDETKAQLMRDILSKYKREQKERLIETFSEQYFQTEGVLKS